MSAARPHDLLRISAADVLSSSGPAPDWVARAMAIGPWVVVRRASAPAGRIAVGVRGGTRDQRWAGVVSAAAVVERWAPEALVARFDRLSVDRRRDLPALAAVPRLAAILERLRLRGGPTGSVGYELVTGQPVVTGGSDLDAVVRADTRMDNAVAAALASAVAQLPVRCDLLLETPNGAVALAEYARGPGPVVLRGPGGPRLVTDPWEPGPMHEETGP